MIIPLEITPATIVVGLLVVAAIVWAVRRIVGRGLCDSEKHCGSSCGHCSAVNRMVENMEKKCH